ncbi:MAG TPA: DNA translocase FtsK 4TM domain-containing protein, partial [Thermodesulfobacteriota bacterium]|nr:DNA translocase FtsK 4TM domain-containing protein [Thermodesulfobacteriota bacterium]
MPKRKTRIKAGSSTLIEREIISALLFTIGIFTSLSLLFYSSSSNTDLDVKGTMGTVGVFISGILGDTFGLCSFIIPVVLLYTAVVVFTNKSGANLYRKAISALIVLFVSPIVLGLIFGDEELLGYSPPGGQIGSLLSTLLRDKIAGTVGSYIIATIFLFMSLIIMSNLTLLDVLKWCGRVVTLAAEGIGLGVKSVLHLGERMIEGLYDVYTELSRAGAEIRRSLTQREQREYSPPPVKEIEIFEEEPKPEVRVEAKNLPQIIVEEYTRKTENVVRKAAVRTNFKLPSLDLLDPKKDAKTEF